MFTSKDDLVFEIPQLFLSFIIPFLIVAGYKQFFSVAHRQAYVDRTFYDIIGIRNDLEDLCYHLNIIYAYCWQPSEGNSNYPGFQYASNNLRGCLEYWRVKTLK